MQNSRALKEIRQLHQTIVHIQQQKNNDPPLAKHSAAEGCAI